MSDFSGHDIEDDYFTLRGIEIRTGIKQVDLINSLLGEMLDNGIDYQEAHNVKNPYINIVVSKENVLPYFPPFLRISVRNAVSPNADHVFSKEMLERIYKFGEYYGSKRIFKIYRGALGDASKLMLGAPYALADSMNLDISNDTTGIIPIVLKTSAKNILKTFNVALLSVDSKQKIITENSENSSEEKNTEVQILLPYDDSGDDSTLYGILAFLRNYLMPNTHNFQFQTADIG